MICAGEWPKPDLAVMVDSGWDRPSTWQCIREVFMPRLEAAGVRLDIIKTTDYMDNGLFDTAGRLKIPAYRLHADGGISKLHTRCNSWKGVSVKRWLRAQGVTACENWVGIAADEGGRARESPHKWITYRYPLIEKGYTREACFWLCGKHSWPLPHQTSCLMCPQQRNSEWALLRDHYPDEFARACEIDEAIRERDPGLYLWAKAKPLREFDC